MSIWGKILGGAAGFALGGPLGALIGAAAGHAVDALSQAGAREPSVDNTRSIGFTIAVIVLGAKMAKADGVVTPNEVDAFKQVFHVPPEETQNVSRIFNLARRDSRGFEAYARQVANMFEPRSSVLEELLLCLFHIAKADGRIDPRELAYLRSVADIFGFDDEDFERIRASQGEPDAVDPYRILGVPATAPDEEVRAAYRRLIREHHPDRLIAEGLPQEFIDVATQKMAAINAAYDRIVKQRERS